MTRQVADAGHRQVQRPRDRRRRQRQDVDLAAELLEPFLGGHPEPLLLVDDDEPEVLEPDVLRQQPVRADDEVDRARRRGPSSVAACSFAEHEPRQQPDLEREGGEPLAERRVVLGGEHGRRHEHRDLLAVLGRLERGRAARPRSCRSRRRRRRAGPSGRSRSMSALTSAAARSWSTVSSYGNDASISACHGVSSRERVAVGARARAAYSASRSSARSATALRTRCFARSHSVPPSLLRRRPLAAGVAGDAADLLDRDEDPVAAGERELEVVALLARPRRAGASARSGRRRGRCGRRGRRASAARGCRAGRPGAAPWAGGRGRSRTARGR